MNEELEIEYCRANSGKRFANYVIDMIVYYIILFFLGFVFTIMFPDLMLNLDFEGLSFALFFALLYVIIMSIFEAAFQGKTVGKLITGTRALRLDGTAINLKSVFIRNLIRAIPFNALSALSIPCTPWHDKLSNTYVVDDKKIRLQQNREVFIQDLKNQTL